MRLKPQSQHDPSPPPPSPPQGNDRIRQVTAGIITTIAGTGAAGYNGDGIAATSAQLYSPYGVALDSAGSVIVADTVRRVFCVRAPRVCARAGVARATPPWLVCHLRHRWGHGVDV